LGSLSNSIDRVLDLLAKRADDDPTWRTDLRTKLAGVVEALQPHVPPGLQLDSGSGFGSMAQVPWVAVLKATQTNQEGYYPVLLFAADGSGLFLSLNQGTENTPAAALDAERNRLRAMLGQVGPRFSETIDLRGSTERPKKYERANIAALQYLARAVPDDDVILADFEEMIGLSERLRGTGSSDLGPSSWIFQSSPKLYDLPAALQKLDQFTWLVTRYASDISAGDRVYLWASGRDAAILAVGRVLTDPADIEDSPEEEAFQRKADKFGGPRRRVRVKVERVLDHPLLRTQLRSHPILKDLKILSFPQGSNFRVTPEQDLALQTLIGAGVESVPEEDQEAAAIGGAASKPTIESLADVLCLDPDYLRDVDWLLRDRQQLVFYGPPGTGKTYVAEEYAAWFAGSPARVETIQFHPSYAYEDFVEGIRPVLDVEELRYALVDGILKRIAERARKDPSHRYVLVVDEINRANLARVFGELLYLLEYRDRAVTLPYSQRLFALPSNLFFIGTMNTADRSIALVDFALRRRFHFIEFPADPAILSRWLAKHNAGMGEVADLLRWVNDHIDGQDFAIGFSYFMRADLDEDLLRRIWQRSILPALHEFYYDNAEKRGRFALAAVRAAVAQAQAAPASSSAEGPELDDDEAGAEPVPV